VPRSWFGRSKRDPATWNTKTEREAQYETTKAMWEAERTRKGAAEIAAPPKSCPNTKETEMTNDETDLAAEIRRRLEARSEKGRQMRKAIASAKAALGCAITALDMADKDLKEALPPDEENDE
jgi:hypothetical protein